MFYSRYLFLSILLYFLQIQTYQHQDSQFYNDKKLKILKYKSFEAEEIKGDKDTNNLKFKGALAWKEKSANFNDSTPNSQEDKIGNLPHIISTTQESKNLQQHLINLELDKYKYGLIPLITQSKNNEDQLLKKHLSQLAYNQLTNKKDTITCAISVSSSYCCTAKSTESEDEDDDKNNDDSEDAIECSECSCDLLDNAIERIPCSTAILELLKLSDAFNQEIKDDVNYLVYNEEFNHVYSSLAINPADLQKIYSASNYNFANLIKKANPLLMLAFLDNEINHENILSNFINYRGSIPSNMTIHRNILSSSINNHHSLPSKHLAMCSVAPFILFVAIEQVPNVAAIIYSGKVLVFTGFVINKIIKIYKKGGRCNPLTEDEKKEKEGENKNSKIKNPKSDKSSKNTSKNKKGDCSGKNKKNNRSGGGPEKKPDPKKPNEEYTFKHGKTHESDKHHPNSESGVGKPPRDAQSALDNSFEVEGKKERVAVQDGKVVTLKKTLDKLFHAYVVENIKSLPNPVKNALVENGFMKNILSKKLIQK
ncbi:MAG: hypothetical protein JO129_03510 [Candidatus Dependentiae bacterium]|nr:hypothetical protein [Candidatus Dependentiae bacterium]